MTGNSAGSSFRFDIQGMRAIAVLSVLAYHIAPSLLPGGYVGVDVFFVISGYLITGLLVRDIERGGIELSTFYARRIRRLLPAATLVLVVVLAATMLLLPPSAWRDIGSDVIASAFYVENWLLVQRSVDYLALDAAPSPAQHFWSLSVEEQFYIFWPVMMLLVARVSSARGWRVGRALLVALSAVSVASLAYGIYMSYVDPAPAYFLTTTRIWELGIGGVLAIWTSQSPDSRPAGASIWGWLGVAAILASTILYSSRLPFPGYEALLPTLGATAMLMAHPAEDSLLGRILAQRPLQYFGDISYSLYLWHWPVVVFYEPMFGTPLDSIPDAVTALVLSVSLAHASKYFVEDKFRYPRPAEVKRPYMIGVGLAATTLGCAIALQTVAQERVRSDLAVSAESALEHPGAVWLDEKTPGVLDGSFIPDADVARMDRGNAYGSSSSKNCIGDVMTTDISFCAYGDQAASRHLVVVGDSHAVHWLPALEKIARTRGWRVTGITKSSCAFTDVATRFVAAGAEREYVECREWVDKVMRWIESERPDALLISQSPKHAVIGGVPGTSQAAIAEGVIRLADRVRSAGVEVAAIKHTPWNRVNVPECMMRSNGNAEQCSAPSDAVLISAALELAAKASPSIQLINLDRYFCFDGKCPVVIGGVLVYRDANHLTATYAASMAVPLGDALADQLESLQ